MTIAARNVSWSAGGRLILDDVDVTVAPGSTLGLLGPNGSGKSSLLRCLAGLRRPAAGTVTLDGVDLRAHSRRQVARRLAFVDQEATTELDLTVLDVVLLGRIPHRPRLAGARDGDHRIAAEALAQVDLAGWERRRWHTLSGGERQRVQIARALAQRPSELLLDEPTNHLDIRHQLELLALVNRLDVTAVIALHDLNLAAAYCDRIALLHRGRIVAAGEPRAVLTPERILDVYGVFCRVRIDDGRPTIRPLTPAPAASASRSAPRGPSSAPRS